MAYETVIGLEIHVQLATNTKIFCGCSTKFGMPPNTNVCPVCLGMPGVLPVLNKKVVALTIKAATALHCTIAPYSVFARKHYFYPDLPKAYQISQYELPFAQQGVITLSNGKKIGITRAHLEEDAGKLLHEIGSHAIDGSFVDLNRSGVPLIEIVSEPDMRSPDEAYEYCSLLKNILEYLEVSDCNMEEGSLRCDANVSLRPVGTTPFGTKAEIKNLNSFKGVQKALAYEVERQTKLLDAGQRIVQETRLWDSKREVTVSMRSKEEAHDYRYFPEPDLVPLTVNAAWISEVQATIPELPTEKQNRFKKEYSLSEYDAGVLTATKPLADYFEHTVRCVVNAGFPDAAGAKTVANWVMVELLGKLNNENKTITESPVTPEQLAALVVLIQKGTISGKIAKIVFEDMMTTGKTPDEIIKEKNLVQISDASSLGAIVDEVLAANPNAVAEYNAGKDRAIGFLVGQIMKKTQGKANPQMVQEILKLKIKN